MKTLRIGQISKIDYEKGRASVLYNDLDGAVTAMLPMLSYGDEYHMPEVEDYVAVLHTESGLGDGIILGKIWTGKKLPSKKGEDVYRKEFSNKQGKAYLERVPGSGSRLEVDNSLTIKASSIRFETNGGSVTVQQIINHLTYGDY